MRVVWERLGTAALDKNGTKEVRFTLVGSSESPVLLR